MAGPEMAALARVSACHLSSSTVPVVRDSRVSMASLNDLRLENRFDVKARAGLTSDPRSPGMASGVRKKKKKAFFDIPIFYIILSQLLLQGSFSYL